MTGTDGQRQLIRGQLKKDCSKCSKINNKIVNPCICKSEICNEKKAAAKQTYNIISYEMQIINNEALHLNSTLKFTKTFTYTMHSQRKCHCSWGEKNDYWGWSGESYILKGCMVLQKATVHKYIVYLCISVILKFHGEGKWLR